MSIKEYRTTLEKINLTLEDYIDNAIVMFGKSKIGMTSAAHFLCHHKLTGYKLNGQPMVEVEGSQLRQQKIGKSYSTETLIPNKFQIKVNSIKQKVLLIDGTGFGNTHESLGILSSGYAHLRIFQRVRSMKFIICFDQKDLFGNGMPFLETLRQFIEFFKNFDTIKNDIMQSCGFLFTKVTDRQNLRSHLSHFANKFKSQLQDEKQKQIKDFVNHVINKDKIFYIKKAEVGQIIQSSTLMNKIDQKIQRWWTRDGIDESDIQSMFSSIDMSLIKVTLIRQLSIACLSGVKLRDQYIQLIQYYYKIGSYILKYTSDLSYPILKYQEKTDLFNLLVEDFMSDSNYCSIFQAMEKFVQQKTLNNNEKELGYQLNTVKAKKIQKIYQDNPLQSQNMDVRTMILTVKKFQTLQKIESQRIQIHQAWFASSRNSRLISLMKSLQNILKYLHQLALWYGRQQLVKKYYYELFQIMNQLRYIDMMISDQNKNEYQIFISILNRQLSSAFIISDIKFIFDRLFEYQHTNYSSIQILRLYIKRMDITQIQQQKDYVIDQQFVQAMFNQKILDDPQCQHKLIDLIQRYSDMVLERIELQQQQLNAIKIDNNRRLLRQKVMNYSVIYTKRLKKQLLKNLFMAIQWSYKHHQLSCENNQQANKRKYTTRIKRLTSNLANLILYKNQYNLAIKLFQSVNMVSSVCCTYEKMIKKLQRNQQLVEQQSSIMNIKLSYVDYLIRHMRVGKAIQLLSSIMSSQRPTQQQLIQLSLKLSELRNKQLINNKIQQYQRILFQRKYFTQQLINDQSFNSSMIEMIEKSDNNSDDDDKVGSQSIDSDGQQQQQQQQQQYLIQGNNGVDQSEDADIDLDDIDDIDDIYDLFN